MPLASPPPLPGLASPHAAQPEAGPPGARRCCASATADARPRSEAASATGSRRRRLWELGAHAHCPVLGVCLPMATLRQLAGKALGGVPLADDYTLHCGAVHDCALRCRLAEAVQRELDRRYAAALRQAAGLKSTEALAAWWHTEATAQRLPGALWATITHPRCTPELSQQVLAQVHMLQHQLGMAGRVDQARLDELLHENQVLGRALAAAQQRCTQQAADAAERQQALQAELVRARGQQLAALSAQALLQDDLRSLRAEVPELASRQALAERCLAQASQLAELRRQLRSAQTEAQQLRELLAAPSEPGPGTPAAQPAPEAASELPRLDDRAVLCVGGRTASVPVYRRLIEGLGARFLHHDGGQEQATEQLEATLAAADLVICQAGCVSHNAYWRVKDHCKRTGKRCVFVDTPSAAGLQRALARMDPAG